MSIGLTHNRLDVTFKNNQSLLYEVVVMNIISIDTKLQLAKNKRAALIKKRKLMAVQRVFQCIHCAFKCEKCGAQIQAGQQSKKNDSHNLRIPYRFCEGCSEEYIDFIDRLNGKGDPDCFWHNDTWLDAWKKWIDYQSTVDRYLKSKEFIQLIKEIKQTGPNK